MFSSAASSVGPPTLSKVNIHAIGRGLPDLGAQVRRGLVIDRGVEAEAVPQHRAFFQHRLQCR